MDDEFEVRTFVSSEEIRALPGYRENNPINNENYVKILGDYWLPSKERCCFLKPNGKLCDTSHKWGFVARLADGSVTVVGNCCAVKQFGADSRMKADRSRYLNEKRRRNAFAALQKLLASKDEITKKLELYESEAKELKRQADEFSSQLTGAALRKMEHMQRTGASEVRVQGISYREYIDDNGEAAKERACTIHTLGRLSGLNCLAASTFSTVARDAQQVLKALDRAETLNESSGISEVKLASGEISSYQKVGKLVDSLRSDVSDFLNSDFLFFCFLTDEKSERYKYAQLALKQRREAAGKEKAKSWLAEQERRLAISLSVDKIGVL